MKITINLSSRRLEQRKKVTAAGWGIALSMLFITMIIAKANYGTYTEVQRLQDELSRLEGELSARQNEYDVWQAQSRVLRGANVERLAQVDFGQGPAATRLLEELERLIPQGVHLLRYQHDRGAGKLEMLASAEGPDGITALMRRLEANPLLSQAVLADQQSKARGGEGTVEAKIILTLTEGDERQ